MFPGYASRLYNEMENLYKEKTLKIEPTKSDNGEKTSKKNKVINIIDSARRKYSVFIGATVLAQTLNSEEGENSGYWITKQDWEEVGPDIVLKKCQNIMA
jgi:actin-related protein